MPRNYTPHMIVPYDDPLRPKAPIYPSIAHEAVTSSVKSLRWTQKATGWVSRSQPAQNLPYQIWTIWKVQDIWYLGYASKIICACKSLGDAKSRANEIINLMGHAI